MRVNKLHSSQRGDTIVEVLISIAVVSLVLVAAYASATGNSKSIQDAQERAQALQVAQRQIEFLKAKGGSGLPASNGCFTNQGVPTPGTGAPAVNNCIVDSTGQKLTDAGVQPAYTIALSKVSPSDPNSSYGIDVKWDSLLRSGTSNVTLYYRP